MAKPLRTGLGMTASRVAVRRRIPWFVWALGGIGLAAALAAYTWWVYDAGLRAAGVDLGEMRSELGQLRAQSAQLAKSNEELSARTARAESQHKVDKAAHDDLAKQVKTLMEENAQLKDELAFFQAVTSGDAKQQSLAVHRLQLRRDTVLGEYRYSMLLVQGGKDAKPFQGRLQLAVRMRQNGRESTMTLPGPVAGAADPFKVSFRFYQRVEGTFKAPVAATVESLQVRVYRDGVREPLVTEVVQLS